MNDEGLAAAASANPFVYPDFTQESVSRLASPRRKPTEGSGHRSSDPLDASGSRVIRRYRNRRASAAGRRVVSADSG